MNKDDYARKQLQIAFEELEIKNFSQSNKNTSSVEFIRISCVGSSNKDIYYILFDRKNKRIVLAKKWFFENKKNDYIDATIVDEDDLEEVESFSYMNESNENVGKPFYYEPTELSKTFNNIKIYDILRTAKKLMTANRNQAFNRYS